jgi:hypothetical protein
MTRTRPAPQAERDPHHDEADAHQGKSQGELVRVGLRDGDPPRLVLESRGPVTRDRAADPGEEDQPVEQQHSRGGTKRTTGRPCVDGRSARWSVGSGGRPRHSTS